MRLFLFLLVATLFGCQSNSAPTPNAEQPTAASSTSVAPPPVTGRKTIVFFGNSLTAAYNLKQEQGFPALIQKKIDALGLAYTCIDAGLSGETTADGVNRVEWILRQPVDIFVLELGGNDALRGLPIEQSRNNLAIIAKKVKNRYPDCKVVLAGMQAPPNLGKTYTNAFRQMYVDIAAEQQTGLIPFLLEGVGGNPRLNLPDGIHPNEEGQKIVAENVWKVLQPLL
jgi:acyl-CoA thioesterase I